MKKRVFSALLALVLTLSAVVLPASAAGSFSDVSDKKTAQTKCVTMRWVSGERRDSGMR